MTEKIITDIDSNKASCPDCISVMVLKNYEPEFHIYLFIFSTSIWKNVGKRNVATSLKITSFWINAVFFLVSNVAVDLLVELHVI